MTLCSLEQSPQTRMELLITTITALQTRFAANRQRSRDERALEGLSYEALKDIGFPAAGRADACKAA